MKLIVSHGNCDLDAFSSMIAAWLLFPEARICLTGASDEVVQRIIKDHHEKFNLIKEKNVKPEELEFVIMVDNSNFNRIGKIGKYLRQNEKLPVICYDHHQEKIDDKRFLFVKQENTGSCVSVILDDLIERNIEINPFYATILALGIYEDTGSFLTVNTTQKDFSAMAFLFSIGASVMMIKKYIKPQFTAEQIQLMNELINNLEKVEILGIEVCFLTISYKDTRQSISMLLQNIRQSENLPCIFCIARHENQILIIGRSDYSFVPVNKILRTFGGGGHPSSGSATVHNIEVSAIQTILYEIIEKFIRRFGTVQEFMSSHVECVNSDISILEAVRILSNLNIGALIVKKNNQLFGIITKKDISKAMLQKIEHIAIEDFVSTDLLTISPDSSVYKAQELMLEKDIGRLPVVRDGQLCGIISRRDLLFAQNKVKLSAYQDNFDNVQSKMKMEIKEETLTELHKIGIVADSVNTRAYIVGGFVRDLLMNRESYDFDIVLEMDAIDFAKILHRKFGYNYVFFPKFRTAIVNIPVLGKIDLVTARYEYYQSPGETPVISGSSLKNDLFRRDFTINSMAIQINQKGFGRLIDYFNGRRDIQLGIVRVLNNMSFSDDPTRILRAIRFEQRFNFKIDQKTFYLLQKAVSGNTLNLVAVERTQQEIIKACYETVPSRFFQRLHELGILKKLNPNLKFDNYKETLFLEGLKRINWFRENFPDEEISDWVIYLAIMTSDLSLRTKTKIAVNLKFPKLLVKTFEAFHDLTSSMDKIKDQQLTDGELTEILRNYSMEVLFVFLCIPEWESLKNRVLLFIKTWRFVESELSGKDIIQFGFESGKVIGFLKNQLIKLRIDKIITSKDQEYQFLKDYKTGENNRAKDSESFNR